ncbi:MAG: electron transport complex subunit E [Gammaproteobacteria bacterium]|nr:electron transport complex subunit E [Gammaproteobacteria bacterium]
MKDNLPEPAPINQPTVYGKLFKDGLWSNNPALIQLLGLCPLLAVTTSFVNGLALGLATCFVLVASNLCVSLTAPFIPASVRLPVYVLIIASLVTSVELIIQAFYFGLYSNLGIFLPLIVTNCTILGRAEAFAAKNTPVAATLDGLAQGSGFGLVLILMGSIREILGSGKIFSDLYTLGIHNFAGINLYGYDGFLLLILPPGGFILLGVLIALKNIINERLSQRSKRLSQEVTQVAGAKRVRVSG